jgi:predicted nucleotidyltransferase
MPRIVFSALPFFLLPHIILPPIQNFAVEIENYRCYNMSMMSINEIREKLSVLKQNRDIHKVILFGSYARGDVTRKSDMDMVVIMDTNKRFFDRYELLDSLYDFI